MPDDLQDLMTRARDVLRRNWSGHATRPAPRLYPHQWSWDSAFIAIGYARYDQDRARKELDSLFSAQWSNGMVSQIVFDPETLGGYFPEPDFWQTERSRHAPDDFLTSGITMPPVHPIAARRIVHFAEDREEATEWLRRIFPRLRAGHDYLYRERDPEDEGLVYIRHPWESGLDNSPVWDTALGKIELDPADVPSYQRRDLAKGIPEEQRPSDEEYDRYVYLADLFRRLDYDEEAIQAESPFLIQDPLFNAILARAGEDLAELGEMLGEDVTRIRDQAARTNRAMNDKMWHEKHAAYDVFDLVAQERIGTITASGFMPLLSGAPRREMAEEIYRTLDSNAFCPMHDGSCFSIPNYNVEGDFFDPDNYWRGPVWVNTNWLLRHGLERYGFTEKADRVREDVLELVRRWGFHEYFDPYQGTGYGTDDFSWTAALFIDAASDLLSGRGPWEADAGPFRGNDSGDSPSAPPSASALHESEPELPKPILPRSPSRHRLRGQKAVVTGANSGIGRGIALALAGEGAHVMVNYITDEEAARRLKEEIRDQGGRALLHRADVSKEEEVQEMFERGREELGTVDILVNNAGLQRDAPFDEMSLEEWNQVLDVNLTGQFLCAREAVREFKRRGVVEEISCSAGKIICISSVHEIIPWAGHVNYAASKGGVSLLMKSMAQEVAGYRIRVNAIAPGAIRTPINRSAWESEEAYRELRELIPYNRIGEVEDVARAAVWLASDESDYVVGTTLVVDGGMTLYPGFTEGG